MRLRGEEDLRHDNWGVQVVPAPVGSKLGTSAPPASPVPAPLPNPCSSWSKQTLYNGPVQPAARGPNAARKVILCGPRLLKNFE